MIKKIKALLSRFKKKEYTLIYDSSITFTSLPRKYPQVGWLFQLEPNKRYELVQVDTKANIVKLQELGTNKTYSLSIDILDEFFDPVDPNVNYPI